MSRAVYQGQPVVQIDVSASRTPPVRFDNYKSSNAPVRVAWFDDRIEVTNPGAINRAALLAADAVLVPLAADLFSLRGLRNLGPTLRMWRRTWHGKVLPDLPPGIEAPPGRMTPLGYVIMQPTMRLDRPVKAYHRWLDRIPQVFASDVLDELEAKTSPRTYEIATLRNYQSLMPLSHDARKPMFDLRTADGALGSTQTLVNRCYDDFRSLAEKLLQRLASVQVEN
nr:hypothetical protein [Frankia sp. Cas4]